MANLVYKFNNHGLWDFQLHLMDLNGVYKPCYHWGGKWHGWFAQVGADGLPPVRRVHHGATQYLPTAR